jgi:general L-amino acid transport system permease protein
MRIAVPPIISQYLNLIKNTSLGVAVAYAEITNLTTISIGNGRPAPQSILVLMGVYLMFSLSISLLLNIYNRHIQLSDR